MNRAQNNTTLTRKNRGRQKEQKENTLTIESRRGNTNTKHKERIREGGCNH